MGIYLVELYNFATTVSAKTFITYIIRYRNLQVFYRPLYVGLVFFADISCHKRGSSLIPCASLFLHLSPRSHPTSFKIQELDCTTNIVMFCLKSKLYMPVDLPDPVTMCFSDQRNRELIQPLGGIDTTGNLRIKISFIMNKKSLIHGARCFLFVIILVCDIFPHKNSIFQSGCI